MVMKYWNIWLSEETKVFTHHQKKQKCSNYPSMYIAVHQLSVQWFCGEGLTAGADLLRAVQRVQDAGDLLPKRQVIDAVGEVKR